MKTFTLYPDNPNRRHIDAAVETLRQGGIIVYPTDTFYAFACDALNNAAIERLCRLKDIDPRKSNLSITCSNISQAAEYVRIDNIAFRYLKEYLPGPFTFILPAASTLPKAFKGRRTAGIRIPDNNVARLLAESLGHPMMTTSISDLDTSDPDAIALAVEPLSDIMLICGEPLNQGSTIVDLTDSRSPETLRQGPSPFIP